jgi:uncharacterized membrane protein YdjX (TVP38/TMEM64 family)
MRLSTRRSQSTRRAATGHAEGTQSRTSSTRRAKPIFKRRNWWWVLGAAAIVALSIWGISTTGFDWKELQHRIASLNGVLVFALMATLPVAGCSVGLIYLVAGAKFGPVLGGVAVAGATVIHLLLTHWISRSFLRGPLLRLLERKKYKLPDIPAEETTAISVMAALVPGVPYFARNYLLALSGVPLGTYFWICLPIYVARSYVTIFLGDLTSDPNRNGLITLVVVYALKIGICAFLIARLRRRYQARKASGKSGQHVAARPS